jgi:L-alanine-DL-glutamate epimerase-like enolase superfamily enzyme
VNPGLTLAYDVLDLQTAHPFGIARGTRSAYRVVWVRLAAADGLEGWGEADPSSYYGETAETVVQALERFRPLLAEAEAGDLENVEGRLLASLRGNAAARAAVSMALHDLVGKRLGVPLWKLWGLDPAASPRSSFTIGIATPAEMGAKVREAKGFPILKIKVGTDHDEALLQAVRDAAPEVTLRVDANAGWSVKQALRHLPMLAAYGVELVEQPLAPTDLDGLAQVRRTAPMPVIADESCLVASDIPRLAGCVDGINIKLAKCGSLREALRMIAVARAHHLRVMVGCMIETSIGITAAAHFTPLLDYVDLDGAALLARDPFAGATIDGGRVVLPSAPGLGVTKR